MGILKRISRAIKNFCGLNESCEEIHILRILEVCREEMIRDLQVRFNELKKRMNDRTHDMLIVMVILYPSELQMDIQYNWKRSPDAKADLFFHYMFLKQKKADVLRSCYRGIHHGYQIYAFCSVNYISGLKVHRHHLQELRELFFKHGVLEEVAFCDLLLSHSEQENAVSVYPVHEENVPV